jgi:sugar lactone lactonase YvrE
MSSGIRALRCILCLSITSLVLLTVVSGCGARDDRKAADAKKTEATSKQDAATTYRLVGGHLIYPEGIAVHGSQFYVTSVQDGDIYRGNLGERTAEVFIPSPGFGSSGIKATATRLVVVQGDEHTGGVTVFDRVTGDRVVRFSNGATSGSVNDVAIAPNGDAYVTDSGNPVLYRIPAAALQRRQAKEQHLPVFMSFRGTPFKYDPQTDSGANGIVVSADNKFLLMANFGTGQLFRIRLADHQVTEVDLHGELLTGGDGMVLAGDDLYVVLHYAETVAKMSMSNGYTEVEPVTYTTDPTFLKPTTAAVAGNRLLVVNSQFEVPGGGKPPWTVSSVPLP